MKNLLSKISLISFLVLVVLLTTTIFVPCASAQAVVAPQPQCWGVFVGISDYQNYESLTGADDDVEELSQELSPTWGDEHIRVLTNSEATKSSILDAIDWLAENAQTNDTAFFCFSGYGEDDGYLCAYDSNYYSYSKDISTTELRDSVSSCKINKIRYYFSHPSSRTI